MQFTLAQKEGKILLNKKLALLSRMEKKTKPAGMIMKKKRIQWELKFKTGGDADHARPLGNSSNLGGVVLEHKGPHTI